MILKDFSSRVAVYLLLLLFIAGCRASGNYRAPVEERGAGGHQAALEERDISERKSGYGRKYVPSEQDGHIQIYVVQKGDTLFSIAFENGLDYREVAEQNNIENPAAIQIGQQIRLTLPDEQITEKNRAESKPQPVVPPVALAKKDYPKMIKLPYSEGAVAQVEKMQAGSGSSSVASIQPVVPAIKPQGEKVKPQPDVAMTGDDNLDWAMPAKGKLIAEYSESANRKGLDIAGVKGQPVLASAAGKVVYSGSGLRGYGKLVIIKHNKTFLSAYAHNDQILVKEGQMVNKGQKIAEMGSSDTDQVKLHFEIRRFGKPVDPAKYLNLGKS